MDNRKPQAMKLQHKSFNCFLRPIKRDDRIMIGGFVGLMISMVWYSGLLWHALLGIPVLVSLLWVCQPQRLCLQIVHGFLLGIIWMVSVVGFGQWLKYYLVEIYKVPTNSMEQTIIPGDRVLVCKWIYGARQFTGEGIERLWGLRAIERGDIVVFNSPVENGDTDGTTERVSWEAANTRNIRHHTPYVKRCVALPGDVVEIREQELRVNGAVQEAPSTAMFRYRFSFSDSRSMTQAAEWVERNLLIAPKRLPPEAMLETFLTRQEADSVSMLPGCTEFHMTHSRPTTVVYPHHDSILWSMNTWGPMRMPQRGDSILLTEQTTRLYAPIVALHEGHRITLTGSITSVDGVPRQYYVFAKDYYFMMGDHRMTSQDSRIIGPIADDHIIGKATHILWSVNPEPDASHQFRWNRILKRLK